MSNPRLLFFPLPLLSHYTRCLALANELKDDFEIFFPHHPSFSSLITESGFDSFECENFDAQEILSSSRRFDFSWLNKELLKSIMVDQCRVIEKYKPVLIVGDASFTIKMAAEKCEVKLISILNGYMSRYYAFTRGLSRTHHAYPHAQKLPKAVLDPLTAGMESLAFRRVHAPFRQLRKTMGLRRINHYLTELEGDITLLCDLPTLFPQKNMPHSFRFIGPLYYEGTHDEHEIVSSLSPDKKTILVSLGSSGDWRGVAFLNNEIFSRYNIIAAGKGADEYLIAPHIIKKKFVNNMALLPHCDLMICHGGNGTIYQAIAHELPILAFTSIFEQEWNMHRIEALGLGQMINDCFSPQELDKIISEWIGRKLRHTLSQEIMDFRNRRGEIFLEVVMSLLQPNSSSINRDHSTGYNLS